MKIRKWAKRIGLGILTLIILSIITGIIYEQIGRYNANKYIETRFGEMVDVGGHSLYYEKRGQGSPTVIFESGFPGDHRAWPREFLEEISNHATTVTYDRAGLLWSERGNEVNNAENISEDLFHLLQNGGFEKPYILVGHSAAGIYFRPFANKHEKDIKGILLIDPSHPGQLFRAPEDIKGFMGPPFMPPGWLVDLANNIGVVRFLTKDPLFYKSIQSGAVIDGIRFLMNESSQNLAEHSFGDIPLVVISAGLKSRFNQLTDDENLQVKMLNHWDELQKDIANSSTNGTRIIAENSGHNMLYSEKELITNEILKLIQLQDSLGIH
jgi:pimeloyl-ACP methyl ester carboxylesterase